MLAAQLTQGEDSNGDWIVLESKGRTNGFDRAALDRAKDQSSQVATVDEQVPIISAGLLSHFGDGFLSVVMDDPDPKSKGGLELPLSHSKMMEGYYRPFIKWFEQAPDIVDYDFRGVSYKLSKVEELDLEFGMAFSLFEEIPVDRVATVIEEPVSDERSYAGRDGLLITLGDLWSRNNMGMQPQERSRNLNQPV